MLVSHRNNCLALCYFVFVYICDGCGTLKWHEFLLSSYPDSRDFNYLFPQYPWHSLTSYYILHFTPPNKIISKCWTLHTRTRSLFIYTYLCKWNKILYDWRECGVKSNNPVIIKTSCDYCYRNVDGSRLYTQMVTDEVPVIEWMTHRGMERKNMATTRRGR